MAVWYRVEGGRPVVLSNADRTAVLDCDHCPCGPPGSATSGGSSSGDCCPYPCLDLYRVVGDLYFGRFTGGSDGEYEWTPAGSDSPESSLRCAGGRLLFRLTPRDEEVDITPDSCGTPIAFAVPPLESTFELRACPASSSSAGSSSGPTSSAGSSAGGQRCACDSIPTTLQVLIEAIDDPESPFDGLAFEVEFDGELWQPPSGSVLVNGELWSVAFGCNTGEIAGTGDIGFGGDGGDGDGGNCRFGGPAEVVSIRCDPFELVFTVSIVPFEAGGDCAYQSGGQLRITISG